MKNEKLSRETLIFVWFPGSILYLIDVCFSHIHPNHIPVIFFNHAVEAPNTLFCFRDVLYRELTNISAIKFQIFFEGDKAAIAEQFHIHAEEFHFYSQGGKAQPKVELLTSSGENRNSKAMPQRSCGGRAYKMTGFGTGKAPNLVFVCMGAI